MPKEKTDKVKKKVVVVEEVVSTPEEVKVETVETQPEEVRAAEPLKEIPEEISPESESEYEKSSYLWIIIPTALLIGALVGGLITYFSGISKLNSTVATPSPVASLEPEVLSTPTALPVSTFKRDEVKVQVLNGSGVSGAAGKAKTLLETAGYKNVDTGNASVSNLTQTEVAVKKSMVENIDTIIDDLSKSYTAVEAEDQLTSTSKYDIVITIGKK